MKRASLGNRDMVLQNDVGDDMDRVCTKRRGLKVNGNKNVPYTQNWKETVELSGRHNEKAWKIWYLQESIRVRTAEGNSE